MKLLKDAGISYLHTHFSTNKNCSTIYAETGPVIIPLRDREKVLQSWKDRKKLVAGNKLDLSWSEMESFIQKHAADVYLLRIDDPEHRDADLAAISSLLGVELEVDFENKVGHGK